MQVRWRRVGSNHRQHDYESCAPSFRPHSNSLERPVAQIRFSRADSLSETSETGRASALVERAGRPDRDVEGVHAADRVRAADGDYVGDPAAGVGGDVRDLLGAPLTELEEEAVQRLVAVFGRPDQ